MAKPAHAATFEVDSTADTDTRACTIAAANDCTLRGAINASNASSTVDDIINFEIPSTDTNCNATTDVCTIRPTSLLPPIKDKATIDGYSQTGADENDAITNANSAVLKIELSGANAPSNAFGLAVPGDGDAGTKIRGLVINQFGDVGVFINAPNTIVEGNFIGTNADGDAELGNGADGVQLLSSGNTVGGPANAAQNVISGNDKNGVAVKQSGATGNTISNNHIGTNAGATEDLGNTESGVFIEKAPGVTVGGSSAAGTLNIISGNDENGVEIIGNEDPGTNVLDAKVLGNLIGVNLNGTGSSDIGNTESGVFVSSASQVEIGGTAGTNPSGPCAGDCNVISDNGHHGVVISDFSSKFNKVQGNRIGTNINGSSAFDLGNAMNGVRIVNATDTTVGGTTEEARNVLSGNTQSGIFISAGSNAANNTVQGNFIGTDATGISDLGNGGSGVRVEAAGNFIGGTEPGARNVISGNGGAGILFNGSNTVDNLVEGNFIGTNEDGTSTPNNLGNQHGVRIAGAIDNTVGGTVDAATNVISGNTNQGVFVSSCTCATGNRILRNSIFENGLLGIELGLLEDGPTPNDKKDPDTGTNNLQNFPVITSAIRSNMTGFTTISGTLNSRPRKTFTIQFFSSPTADPSGFGEGKVFLGEKTVRTNRKGKTSFTFTPPAALSAGENVVTATATRNSTGDTSEFSRARTVQ
jgi:hypothetical protein